MSSRTVNAPESPTSENHLSASERKRVRRASRGMPTALKPQNAGALYVLLALIVLFSIWQSGTFPEYATATSIVSDNTVAAVAALALIIPLAAGEYDLSVGYVVGFSGVLFALLLSNSGVSPVEAALVVLVAAAVIGCVNGVLVVGIGLNSFIATLASGSLIAALIQILTNGLTLSAGVSRSQSFATSNWHNVTIPMGILVLGGIALWVFMQHTAAGRRLYATGMGREAARMAGIKTGRMRFFSLTFSATVAGFAGIIVTTQIGAASADLGPPYLIPAFAAAFLGATQFTPGLFNSGGTLLAILLLGTLNSGLAFAGVPTWVPLLSTGSVLIIALAIGQIRERDLQFTWGLRFLRPRPPSEIAREAAGVSS